MQASNSCFSPVSSKMSKVKKILAEACEEQTRELDLVDQNISALEECPKLSEYNIWFAQIWAKCI